MSDLQDRQPVRFLVFSAALRTGSLNARLADLAAQTIQGNGGEVDFARMSDFDAPSYDADAQANQGLSGDRRGISRPHHR